MECKPSDMLPELQGRLPVKAELKHLSENDFYRILSEPQFNLLAQQAELLKAENINLSITPSAVRLIAHYTHHLNSLTQNLGARYSPPPILIYFYYYYYYPPFIIYLFIY